ncbi:MAG: hypothetical protein QOF38_1894, partial [Pseudonocardiales bacterium]|nr:hypothetical protein [Pseudonocardiales bacterium]
MPVTLHQAVLTRITATGSVAVSVTVL